MIPLEELRRLSAEATKGTWHVADDDYGRINTALGTVGFGYWRPDVELIALMRNSLDALLDVAEAARDYVENEAVTIQGDRWYALTDALARLDGRDDG